jgi:hypothetical protein
VICGLVTVFAANLMWWIQRSNNSAEGQVSELSSAWEVNRMLTAIVLIVGGIASNVGSSQVAE